MPSQFHNSKGFTLLELLVVISIIGLMASIVLVSLDISREKAIIAKGLQFGSSIYHAHGDELVGFWNFNEADGTDSSGYGNHGTLNGGPVPSNDSPNSALGKSFYFAWSGNNISIPSNDNLKNITDAITIEAWLKSTKDIGEIINKKTGFDGWNLEWRFGGVILFQLFKGGGGTQVATNLSFDYTDGKWHHIVATWEIGKTMDIYIDGKEADYMWHGVRNIEIGTNDSSVVIGGFCDANIDEVRIYKTALSASEIQKHYAEGAERYRITLK